MCSGKVPRRGRRRPTECQRPNTDKRPVAGPFVDDLAGADDGAPPELARHRLPSFEWMDSQDDEPQPEPGDFCISGLDVDDEHL